MAKPIGYSKLQIGLHWAIALLIFGAFITHEEMHKAFDERLASGVTPGPSDGTLHTMMGGLAFVLIVVRVIVRFNQGAPEAAEGSSEMAAKAAHWGHLLLYVLMVGVPIGGMIAWFRGIEIVGDVHGIVGKALILIALGHAAMALYHQFYVKDGTLTRMFRAKR